MDEQQLIAAWTQETQQHFQGWDFSYLRDRHHEEKPPWSYEVEARALLAGVDRALDMGTGGGEKLREFQDVLPRQTLATEGYAPNIPLAQANLRPYGIQVIPYDSEVEPRMPFREGGFPLVLNRHEAFNAAEVARILRPGGVFLTQQVGGRELEELYTIFDFAPSYPHVTLENFRQQLEAAGLRTEKALAWRGESRFDDVGALVYFLHAAPWQAPPDFSVQRYARPLLALHARPKPLTFTIRRFLLWMRRDF